MVQNTWPLLGSISGNQTQSKDRSSEEKLLESKDSDGSCEAKCNQCEDLAKSLRLWKVAIATLSSLLVVPIFVIFLRLQPRNNCDIPTIYSPAESAVEYQTVVFRPNFHEDNAQYAAPPSERVDDMWDELYDGMTNVRIDRKTAELLPNKTLSIPGEEDQYVIGIEVFHQLHCLNTMRKAIYSDHYKPREGLTPKELFRYETHLKHCIEVLRQTIQCYSDTTAIPWAWEERRNVGLPTAHTLHVCRDFEKIQHWARERSFEEGGYAARLAALQNNKKKAEDGGGVKTGWRVD